MGRYKTTKEIVFKEITSDSPSAPEVDQKDGKAGEDENSSPKSDYSLSIAESKVSKEKYRELINQQFLEDPKKFFNPTQISFITPETIEALNQKYANDPTLSINIETIKALPTQLEALVNKNLLIKSIVDGIDIAQPFNEQIEPFSEEEIEEVKPLITQKINNEFLKDPTKAINTDYIDMISPETLKKIPEGQSVNSQIIDRLSIPQLESLQPSILADYVIQNIDLSKPLREQPISDNLKYFLEPKAGYEKRKTIIESFEENFIPKLIKKVNTEIAQNPNINLNKFYLRYIEPDTIKNLKPDQTLNSSIIENLTQAELKTIQPKIIARYIISKADIVSQANDQEIDMTDTIQLPRFNIQTITKLPDNIEKFLQDKKNQEKLKNPLEKEFEEHALEELKEKVNAQSESSFNQFINVQYLNLLTPANMQNLATFLVTQTDLQNPFDQQVFSSRIKGYQDNKEFWNIFKSKLKEEINAQFSNNPRMKLSSKYVHFLNAENLATLNKYKEITKTELNQNPTQPVSHPTYLEHLNITDIKELPSDSTLAKSTLDSMNQQLLNALPQEILVRSLAAAADLAIPIQRNFSPLIQDMLNQNSVLQEEVNKKLQEKINSDFTANPAIQLDASYIPKLDIQTLKNLNPDATVQSSTIKTLSEEQLEAVPQEIIVKYMVDQINLFRPEAKYSNTISKYLEKYGNQINPKLEKALGRKVNDFVSQNPPKLIYYKFIYLLIPENQEKLAQYIAQEIDLNQPLTQQKKPNGFSEYESNSKDIPIFWKLFESKVKEKINKEFKKNPNIDINYTYLKYISTGTIKNLKLETRQIINFNVLNAMDTKQLSAFQPDTLQKIIDNPTIKEYYLSKVYEKFATAADQLTPEQIKVLADITKYIPSSILTKMNLSQINALEIKDLNPRQLNELLATNNQAIILSVMKKINASQLSEIENSQFDLNLNNFFNSLSADQLEELTKESIDPKIKNISEQILKTKYKVSLPAK